jgi:hypothetical protein
MSALMKCVDFVYRSTLDDLGIPISVKRLLDTPDAITSALINVRSQNISERDVVQWSRWGEGDVTQGRRKDQSSLLGWRRDASGRYGSFFENRTEFSELVKCTIVDNWVCDISAVGGFSSSKSNLKSFSSISEMIETNSRAMINPLSEEKLRLNLAHDEIRIIHRTNNEDYFSTSSWDGRLFLINGGGSHHFGAAQYISDKLDVDVPLQGQLRRYSINRSAINSLVKDYEIFAIKGKIGGLLEFREVMQKFGATFLSNYLPRPFNEMKAIFLPRSDARSMKIATLFAERNFFNLGQYLGDPHLHV